MAILLVWWERFEGTLRVTENVGWYIFQHSHSQEPLHNFHPGFHQHDDNLQFQLVLYVGTFDMSLIPLRFRAMFGSVVQILGVVRPPPVCKAHYPRWKRFHTMSITIRIGCSQMVAETVAGLDTRSTHREKRKWAPFRRRPRRLRREPRQTLLNTSVSVDRVHARAGCCRVGGGFQVSIFSGKPLTQNSTRARTVKLQQGHAHMLWAGSPLLGVATSEHTPNSLRTTENYPFTSGARAGMRVGEGY